MSDETVHLESSIAVVSGKGGVGKTNLVVNLAIAAANLGAEVLAVDGDLGLANIDVLLGLVPSRNAADVIDGICELDEATIPGPHGVRFIAAGSARSELAALDRDSLQALLRPIARASTNYDLVLVDAGAGVGPTVVGLAVSCARVIVVTTPEPTSLADAYATLKVLHQRDGRRHFEMVVNEARSEREARETHAHLRRLTRRFLDSDVAYLGFLPADPRLALAVGRQRAVVDLYPGAPSSRHLVALAERLVKDGARA